MLLQSTTTILPSELSVEERWVKVFNTVDETKLTNVFRIVSFVLSIPSSNALVERVFSVMNSNGVTIETASVELIRNELFIYFNCSWNCSSCSEFYVYCLGDKKLLKSAKSSMKYWRYNLPDLRMARVSIFSVDKYSFNYVWTSVQCNGYWFWFRVWTSF